MTVTVIGTGLIGGSMALALKQKGFAQKVIGVDANVAHAQRALELQLVDEISGLKEAIEPAQLIIVAVPVNEAEKLLPKILNEVQQQVVMDVGSTKGSIVNLVQHHKKRSRFVATHPMWGTEYSGPEAAMQGAFLHKAAVICNEAESDDDACQLVRNVYAHLGMHLLHMSAAEHDMHVAYVSHISHITSFALANTVLEKEQQDEAIFALASAGFESTVRLAKSNAAMWVPVLLQNRENVLDVLNEHITQLQNFKTCIENSNEMQLRKLIEGANKIRRIIK